MMDSAITYFQSALKSVSLSAVRGDRVFLLCLLIPFVFLLIILGSDLRLFIFLMLAYTSGLMGFFAAKSMGVFASQELKSMELSRKKTMLAEVERTQLQQTIRQLALELSMQKEKKQSYLGSADQIQALMASHELKEPLRTISSYIQLLGDRHLRSLNEEGQDFLHFIGDAAGRMQEMIEDVLAFTKVSDLSEPAIKSDINFVVGDTLRLLGAKVRKTKAIIEVSQMAPIAVDKRQFSHLLQNLIDNSLKYCNADIPRIQISGVQEGKVFLLKVSDNGIGIEKAYKHVVFDLFRRLHGVGEYAGSGIGLAICKKIAENHRGSIWVESEGIGKGATFCVALPVLK